MGRRPVKIGNADETRQVYVYRGDVANRAIQMAGLELGMFTERKEIKHLSSEFEKMSDLEIVQMLEAEARRLLLEDHSGGDGGKDGKDRS